MEHLCPQIEQLVSCFTCSSQTLPPYRLCAKAHVGCPSCIKYMSLCACGSHFLKSPNTIFDWVVSAMKLQCKYRANDVDDDVGSSGPEQVDCADRWFTVQELRDHYLTGCTKNLFTCPLQNCGHVARVDTITDHYETVHGPFEPLSFNNQQAPKCAIFKLHAKKQSQILKKICNGYFMFSVKKFRRRYNEFNPIPLSMQNINPSDSLKYTYTALLESNQKMIIVSVTLVEPYNFWPKI
ncbi:uncharacterized protein LOC112597418 [Melanaphis sacchari]|uniref:uncharacterized protein LOC112597418 n=1 Tax=Melanaphis sacchari TaxID=742174 RepID=UPI000DC1542B|nr:uncharacterized protein LOC112597418 [Melanaphis sacchari]